MQNIVPYLTKSGYVLTNGWVGLLFCLNLYEQNQHTFNYEPDLHQNLSNQCINV